MSAGVGSVRPVGDYRFDAPLWRTENGSWVFVTVPFDVADAIDEASHGAQRGFGSVRVEAVLGPTTWRTSLFPDKRLESFVLPVKRAVRDAAGVDDGDVVHVELTLLDA